MGFWQNSVVIYCQPAFIFLFHFIHSFFYPPLCPFLAAKVRRLYDIANVLRSLKLIDKVHVTCEERGRKPAFEWVGPEDFPPIRGDFVLHLQSQHCATIMNLYLTSLKRAIEVRTAFLLLKSFYPLSSSPPPLTSRPSEQHSRESSRGQQECPGAPPPPAGELRQEPVSLTRRHQAQLHPTPVPHQDGQEHPGRPAQDQLGPQQPRQGAPG